MHKKHPKELYVLAISELCERFAFWGVGFMLVLYLVDYYQYENARATNVYGMFSGCATFLPLIGGYIADRWNHRTPLWVGALVNAIGCFMLALGNHFFLFPSLFIIACGYGIFTPSILTLLGHIYHERPSLREAGFSIYYAAINIGVFLALISLGFIAQQFSWSHAFFFAGLIQMIGLIPIVWVLKKYKETYRSLDLLRKASKMKALVKTKEEKDRILVILLACLFSILFWIAYNQGFSSLSLFAKDFTNRIVLGWEMPPSWILSSESLGLILLAPFLARLYHILQKRNRDPSPMNKMALSLLFMALCFSVMMWASFSIPSEAKQASISPLFSIGAFLLMAVGEMLLMPIGLSLITQLAPQHLTGLFVGIAYLCVGFAFYIGGVLAGFMERVGGLFNFFGIFVALTFFPALILFFLAPKLTRMSHHRVTIPPPDEAGL